MNPALFLSNCVLTLLLLPALPFIGLALLIRPRYRRGLRQRLSFLPLSVQHRLAGQTVIWLHAASVGEILATRPFLSALKKQFPDTLLVLSVLTPTAYDAAQTRLPEADAVIYFPIDHPLLVQRVLKCINPSVFFFTETEMWPNCLSALAATGVPTVLVSGRFSSRAVQRYRFFGLLFQPIFQSLSLCCMQTQEDAERLIAAGVPQECVSVTGNFKVDGGLPVERPQQMDQMDQVENIADINLTSQINFAERLVLVAASTHRSEETVLLESYQQLRRSIPQLLLLLAPRHPQRFAEVETLLQTGGYRYCKRSQAQLPQALHNQNLDILDNVEVFLLDSLGELSSFYSIAALAFVGGSLIKGPGGHSVIEPALAQIPVIFGPYTRNFSSIVHALKQSGGGIEITDVASLCERILPLLQDASARQAAGRQAYTVIQHEQGAVERTLTAIRNKVWRFQNM